MLEIKMKFIKVLKEIKLEELNYIDLERIANITEIVSHLGCNEFLTLSFGD